VAHDLDRHEHARQDLLGHVGHIVPSQILEQHHELVAAEPPSTWDWRMQPPSRPDIS